MKSIDLRKFEFLLAAVLITLTVLCGCGGGDKHQTGRDESETPLPDFRVVRNLPLGDSAAVTDTVSVELSKPIVQSGITAKIRDESRSLNVPVAQVNFIDSRTFTVSLEINRLLAETDYRVQIEGIRSTEGEELPGVISWDFKTGLVNQVAFVRPFDYPLQASGNSIAIDAEGHRFLAGSVQKPAAEGGQDAFLALVDQGGSVVWEKTFGGTGNETGDAVAVGADGNVYVAGVTNGTLATANGGGQDLYIARFNIYGAQASVIQNNIASHDFVSGIAVDSARNVVYAVGTTFNPGAASSNGLLFLYYPNRAFGLQRTVLQIADTNTQAGSTSINDIALAANGEIYVAGSTAGALPNYSNGSRSPTAHPIIGGTDAFWYRYNPEAVGIRDTMVFGTGGDESANAIAYKDSTTGPRLLIGGTTTGALYRPASRGGTDFFLAQYDPSSATSGIIRSTTFQDGTAGMDLLTSLAFNPELENQEFYFTGSTTGAYPGLTSNGGSMATLHTASFSTATGLFSITHYQSDDFAIGRDLQIGLDGKLSVIGNDGTGNILYNRDALENTELF